MLVHRGFGASIYCGGVELQQYELKVHHDSIVSCYIASELRKEVTIVVADYSGCAVLPAYSVVCGIDGQVVDSLIGLRGEVVRSMGFRSSRDLCYPYTFTALLTTDDEHAKAGIVEEELGVISVEVYRISRVFGPSPTSAVLQAPPEGRAVHSSLNKAGQHRVSFGPLRQYPFMSPTVSQYQVRWLDIDPVVTFQFRYFPKEILQARDIIPRPLISAQAQVSQDQPMAEAKRPKRDEDNLPAKRRRSDESPGFEQNASESSKRLRCGTTSIVKRETSMEVKPELSVKGEILDPLLHGKDDEADFSTLQAAIRAQQEQLQSLQRILDSKKDKKTERSTLEASTSTRPESEVIDLT